jgi:hypothetical protein
LVEKDRSTETLCQAEADVAKLTESLSRTCPHPRLWETSSLQDRRERAAEMRTVAASFTDDQIKRLLIALAESYEKSAARIS